MRPCPLVQRIPLVWSRPPRPRSPSSRRRARASCSPGTQSRSTGRRTRSSILDQYVRDAREALSIQAAGLPLLQAAVGAYFGEVLRRAFDASWFVASDHDAWRLDFRDVYLTFNPIGMAREALTLSEAEGWHAHLEMDDAQKDEVLARLAGLPPVSDDEYYAPSTRFDVVELAVETLRARAHADGLADVRFTAEDYRRR